MCRARAARPGVAKVFKLSSNETPLGPSPRAIAAYQAVGAHLEDYPDGSASELREAIGRAFGLDPDRIVCGAGSDDLLNLLARAYLADGDEAIHATHGFLVYPIATLGAGAKPVVAPETNYTADVDAMLAAVTTKTKIVFLANPEQSDRHLHSVRRGQAAASRPAAAGAARARRRLRRIRAAQRLRVRASSSSATSENVVMCRTFSKIHGLAALRLGWMYGPAHVIDAINRIRGPFNVNAPAIAAGIAAIEDIEHQEHSRAHNARWLAWLTTEDRQARPRSDAERRQFSADPFSRDEGPYRQGGGRLPHRARAHSARRSAPTSCRMRCA